MIHNIEYAGLASRRPSVAIWNRVPENWKDGIDGFDVMEDFIGFGGSVTTNVGTYIARSGLWRSYEDTGASVDVLSTEVGGVLKVTTDTTDNDEAWLQPGSAAAVEAKITSGDSGLVAFEARVRFSQIANQNAFIGLGEEGLAAADTITDAGALASKDLIGFAVLEAAPTALSFVYRKAGQAVQTVIASAKTLVADTWYKVGFLYDSAAPSDKRIRIFIDGVEQSTYVTGTNIAAATFPSGEEMGRLFGVKNASTAAVRMDCDWIRVASAL